MKILLLILGFCLVVESQAQRFVRAAKNYAELQALNPNDPTATNIFVNGYSTVNDGGQGVFSWIWASATTSDGGTVLPPTAGTWSGRWKRQYDGDLNPAWFGANAGGAVSSLLSISNAMNAASGKVLRFPSGVFRINGVLQPPPGTTIEGVGPNTVLFIDSQDYGFLLNNRDRVTFRNLKFFGPSVQAIHATNSSNLLIQNCEFTGFVNHPTATAESTAPFYGVRVAGLTIENCKFYGNGFQASHEPAFYNNTADIVLALYCSGVNILRNDIRETVVNIPIATFDCQGLNIRENFIDQGNFGTNSLGGFANTGYGILSYVTVPAFNSGVLCSNINVTDNTITNTAGSGIYVVGFSGANIQGNSLLSTALQQTNFSVLAAAINVSAGSGATLIGNRIRGSSNNGIVLSAGLTNVTAIGNTISDVWQGMQLSSGETPQVNITISGNVISNSSNFGIRVDNGTNHTINGNQIANSRYGVIVGTLARSSISGNSIFDCTTAIQFLAGNTNEVARNFIVNSTNSAAVGIDFRGTNSVLVGNTVRGYPTRIADSGSGNTKVMFDNEGVGVNIDRPERPLHLYTATTAAAPQAQALFEVTGQNAGSGAALDFRVRRPDLLTPFAIGRIAGSLVYSSTTNMVGDIDVYTTTNAVLSKNFTFYNSGIFNSSLGYRVGGLAGSGLYMRGNGLYGVFDALNGSDISAGTVAPPRLGSGTTDATTVLFGDGTWKAYLPGTGTVSSVGLTMPTGFAVSGSPVTGSGNLGVTESVQAANLLKIGPASGAAAIPTYRAMATADITDNIVTLVKINAAGVRNSATYLSGDGTFTAPSGSTGAVTSVSVTGPADLTFTGNPITNTGTINFTRNTQTSNTFLRGPVSGAPATPVYGPIVAADIPNATISVDKLIGAGTRDSTTYYRGDGSFGTPTGGSGTFFADPSGLIGLSVVNGSSTSALRSDGLHALSQAIVPVWTGLHTFLNATTNQVRIGWDPTQSTWIYGDSGGQLNILPTGSELNLTGIMDASAGFKYANAATSGNYLRGNGTAFISAQLSASDLATGTVPTARLGSGTANSTTFLSGDQTYKTAVTSVNMNGLADLFTVSGVPITTTGTINPAKISLTQNLFYATPDGIAGVPTFRAQMVSDLPSGTPFVISVANINSGAAGQTALLTVPTGKRFIVIGAEIEPTTVNGATSHSQAFIWTLGIDATVDNIWPIKQCDETFLVNTFRSFYPDLSITQNIAIATATQAVKINIDTPSSPGFEIVFTFHLRGYYR